jgi:hypothetical protein
MNEWAFDALVILDGENPNFRSYILCSEVDRINECGGLAGAEAWQEQRQCTSEKQWIAPYPKN